MSGGCQRKDCDVEAVMAMPICARMDCPHPFSSGSALPERWLVYRMEPANKNTHCVFRFRVRMQ